MRIAQAVDFGVICSLFGIRPDDLDRILQSRYDSRRLGCNLDLVIGCRHWPHNHLPAIQADVKRLRGGDAVDGGPLYRDVALGLRLDEERFGIGFYDCARH